MTNICLLFSFEIFKFDEGFVYLDFSELYNQFESWEKELSPKLVNHWRCIIVKVCVPDPAIAS